MVANSVPRGTGQMTKIREPGWGSGEGGEAGADSRGHMDLVRKGCSLSVAVPRARQGRSLRWPGASDFLKRIEKSTCFYKVSCL